jgi:hypothetical protein
MTYDNEAEDDGKAVADQHWGEPSHVWPPFASVQYKGRAAGKNEVGYAHSKMKAVICVDEEMGG